MTIMSKQSIAEDADEKAAIWAQWPDGSRPENPFCQVEQPDHFRAWKESFERSLLQHSAEMLA